MKIELRQVSSLRPHPQNYRRHPESQLAVLRDSLRIHGIQKPVVIQADGTVLAGHALVEAAKMEGMTEIPCHVYDGPYPEAFLVIDNRSNALAEDDTVALVALLKEQDATGQLLATGYRDEDLSILAAEIRPKGDGFDVAAAMADPNAAGIVTRTQRGGLWQLGRHRLLCGDATDPASWEGLMAGKLAQAVVTDPPYGINYVGGRAAQEERIPRARRGVDAPSDAYWDDLTPEQYCDLLVKSLTLAHAFSDEKAPLYLWFASTNLRHVLGCLAETGWQERNLLVWVKNNGAGALFAQYKHWYEPLMYAFKRGQAPRWHGPSNERTVWEHDKPIANDLHPTMKPVVLIERAISNATEPGQLVLDAFLGSGTAIVAAERTGRICYGMDLEPRYCDVAIARWEAETGGQAVLAEEAGGG